MRNGTLVKPIWDRKADEQKRLFEQLWRQMEKVCEIAWGMKETGDWLQGIRADRLLAIVRQTEDLAYTIERHHAQKHVRKIWPDNMPEVKAYRKAHCPEADAYEQAMAEAEHQMDLQEGR